jgi:E3 ubiquitin-protein ligase TRIP12
LQELDLQDILTYDAELGKTLQELQVLVCRKQHLESTSGDNSEAVADLRFRGAPIEDLCLDFTLPGYPDYILKPGDENVYNLYLEHVSMFCIHFFIDFVLVKKCLTYANF